MKIYLGQLLNNSIDFCALTYNQLNKILLNLNLKKIKKLIYLIVCLFSTSVFSQLPNGSVAPDFTLVDYYGNNHNLYSYLNAGKTVFVEIFAAHCPSCWGYHQTHKLKNMYNNYGPNGTNELMVLTLEYDQWNDSNAFIGNGPAWVTQGNWLDGTPYPIFDVEDPNRTVFTDYNVNSYPVVYKICPNKILERIMTNETESQLYQKVQDCQSALSINNIAQAGNIYVDQHSKNLIINNYQTIKYINVINLQGQIVKSISAVKSSTIDISDLNSGVYLFELYAENNLVRRKLYLN